MVGREKPIPSDERLVIRLPVVLVYIAPVALGVTLQKVGG
jgi:hypothetical protein